MVASASRDTVLLWDAATGERLLRLEGRWDIATGLAFSPDGKMVASISEGAVNLWDVEVDSVDAKAEDVRWERGNSAQKPFRILDLRHHHF
jgi:WD40 repeat protein